jgi:hypothetical protein
MGEEGGRRGEAEPGGGEGGSGLRHDELICQRHMVESPPDLKARAALGARSSRIEFCKIKDEQRESETDHKIYPFPLPRHLISILSLLLFSIRHPVPSYRATLRIHACQLYLPTCTHITDGHSLSAGGQVFSHHLDTAIVLYIRR